MVVRPGQVTVLRVRAIALRQPKRVHRSDLIQLLYLAGVGKGMIITADQPFLEDARSVLHGRFMNVRAVHLEEMLG